MSGPAIEQVIDSDSSDQAMSGPAIEQVIDSDSSDQSMIDSSNQEDMVISDGEPILEENIDDQMAAYDELRELDNIQEIFEESLDSTDSADDPLFSSFYSRNVAVLPTGEKKFIDEFISQIIQVKVDKSIPDKHAVELGSVLSKYFIMASKMREHIHQIMSKYCGSSYLQKQFLVHQKHHRKPVTIQPLPNLSIQYFPIENILRGIIAQHPWLIDSIMQEQECLTFIPEHERKYLRIRDELDTTDKEMFDRLVGKLRVEISLDDFSFMGKSGRKFLVGYLSCSNLPYKERTKRNKIYMFLMVRRPEEKVTEVMNKILTPFVQEMKKLELDGIAIDGNNRKIPVTLSKVACDNLAQNEILGLLMSFGQGSSCRECFERFENYPHSRSHSIVNSSGTNINEFVLSHNYREPKPCILTELNGITRHNIVPPDPFHDLYGKFECFMRLSEVFFDEFKTFLLGDEKQLYEDTIAFIRLSMSFDFNSSDLASLDNLSESIINLFTKITVENSLKLTVTFKMHKLLHYSEDIKRFGPPTLSNTLRFERCHQTSKKYGRVMNCWVSPASTLSNRISMRQTLELIGPTLDKVDWIERTMISEEEVIGLNLEAANN
ncbi:hypothetical protein BLA29_000939, partial [Euroglyphus maynei]